MVVVLDRAADGAGLGDPADRSRGVLGVGPKAVLQVDRQRQVGRPIEEPGMIDQLLERDAAVRATQGEGEAGAGGGQGLESEPGQDLGRAGVPGVGDDEWLALVEGLESGCLLVLGRSRHVTKAIGPLGS